jgi:hypothetical protein
MSDLETLLRERLATIVEPQATVPPGLAEELHRRHRRRQRRVATGVAASGLPGVIGMVLLGGLALGGSSASLQQTGDAPGPTNTPVPGITPAFTPQSGRDWLPSPAQFEQFRAAHPVESLGPEPPGTTRERLLQEVQHAGLPAGAVVRITAGDLPSVSVRLANGVPIYIERYQKLYPTAVNPDGIVSGSTYDVVDVPGTSDAALLRSRTGYGWPRGTVGDSDANHDGDTNDSPSVLLATSRGLTTFWVAPASASLETLRQFAFSADQWAAVNPD